MVTETIVTLLVERETEEDTRVPWRVLNFKSSLVGVRPRGDL